VGKFASSCNAPLSFDRDWRKFARWQSERKVLSQPKNTRRFLRFSIATLATLSPPLSWFWPNPSISSQLIDNLNASIHLRALLTDLFLLDEILRKHVKPAGFSGSSLASRFRCTSWTLKMSPPPLPTGSKSDSE
jgi:hypothetical protein